MKVEVSRRFRGIWIPREIWLDETMTLLEKCVLAEVDSLAVGPGGCCTATNRYLALFFQVTERHIKRPIAALAKRGLLRIEKIGRNRRRLYVGNALIQLRDRDVPTEGQKSPSVKDIFVRPHQFISEIKDQSVVRKSRTVAQATNQKENRASKSPRASESPVPRPSEVRTEPLTPDSQRATTNRIAARNQSEIEAVKRQKERGKKEGLVALRQIIADLGAGRLK